MLTVQILGRIEESLPHVSRTVEAFLIDSFPWTLEAGCNLRLLDKLLALEHPDVGVQIASITGPPRTQRTGASTFCFGG